MMPQNDGFALKLLQNYKNARAHFLAFGSKLTQSEGQEKFTFPEVKHNAWLIHHSEKLAASLHGLMVQQTAAQHVDLGTTEAQQRGIVNAERVARSSSKNPHEHTRALNYHRASNRITTAARGHLNGALDGLELDEALKEESAKVEERKKKAAGEDLKRIEAELAEIEQFQKQLPKMREAIQEFTKQQIFEALSKEKLAKAARDAELGNASSETGLINDGYALSEAQKKANSIRYIDIPVRFGGSNGKIALGVEDKYDAEGRVNRSFTIAAKHLTKHRLGLRPIGRLNSVGRHDLMRGMHEKMHEVNSETYNINFSELNVSTDDYQSYLEFLVTSLDISSEYLDQQFEASKNPPYTFSTNVIMHDGSVQSLDEFILKHSSWEGLWLLSTGQVRAIKLKNNTIGSKKTKLIVQKTDDIIAHAKVSDPSNKSMAAKNALLEGTQLTVAAHNAIAKAFEKIDVIGSDVSLAAKAVQQLLSAKNAAQAAHEKAKTLVHQAEGELNRQLKAHTSSTAKSPELTELETLVKAANHKLRETEVALVKIEEVSQQFHDAFDATKFADRLTLEKLAEIVVTLKSNEKIKLEKKINPFISVVTARLSRSDLDNIDTVKTALEKLDSVGIKEIRKSIVAARGKARAVALKTGLGDRNTAIQALAPVVGLHAPSVEGIAKILWAADNNNPPTTAEINAACDEFKAATPAQKIAMLNRAFDFNAKDTMKALTAAYDTVKGPLRDPAKVAAMVVDGRPAAETEQVLAVDINTAADLIVTDHHASAVALAGVNVARTVGAIHADPGSSRNIGIHANTAQAVVTDADTATATAVAKIDVARTVGAIHADPDSSRNIGIHADTVQAVHTDADTATAVAKINVNRTATAIRDDDASAKLVIQRDATYEAVRANSEISNAVSQINVQNTALAIATDYESAKAVMQRNIADIIPVILNNPTIFFALVSEANDVTLNSMVSTLGLSDGQAAGSIIRDNLPMLTSEITRCLNAYPNFLFGLSIDIRRQLITPLLSNAATFAATFALASDTVRLDIISAALADWDNADFTSALKLQIIKLMLGFDFTTPGNAPDPARFAATFALATPAARLTIIETALRDWANVPADLKLQVIKLMLGIDPAALDVNPPVVVNAARFAATFALATNAARLAIIETALRDWVHVPENTKLQIITFMLQPGNAARFSDTFALATEEVRVAIIETVLADPDAFHALDSQVKQAVIAAIIAKHPNDPKIKDIIKDLLISADPLAISSNASIDALALVVAGNDTIKSMLVEILADARIAAALAGRVVLTRLDAIREANREIAANPAAALRRGFLHNPAAGLSILNAAYEVANTTPKATAALIAAVPAAFGAMLNTPAHDFAKIISDDSESKKVIEALNGVPGCMRVNLTSAITKLSTPLETPISTTQFKNVPLEVSAEINRAGLSFNEVRGDGNCFYYAIAVSEDSGRATDLVQQDDRMKDLRTRVADQLSNNRGQYEGAFNAKKVADPVGDYSKWNNFDEYVAAVRKDDTDAAWADDIAIVALGVVLGRPIYIIGQNGEFISSQTESEAGEPLFVHYNGLNHYDAFVRDPTASEKEILARLQFQKIIAGNAEVQKKVAEVIANNPAGAPGDNVRAIIDRTRAMANPASIGEALIRDPLLEGSVANTSLSAGMAHCVGEVKKAKKVIKVNALAMSVHEAEKSAHVASALVDPAAAIATRKMIIGALTRVVSAPQGNPANNADAAALAVIAATDAEVWAELVLEDHNVARRTAIARCVPKSLAANEAAALLMLNNRAQAKIALKAALDSNDLSVVNAVCKGIRNVLLAIIPDVNREAKVRIAFDAESNPLEVLAVVRKNHGEKMKTAIEAEVGGLSEKAVLDIAKVNLAVCALMLRDTAPAAPAVPDKLLSEIAKWVPNPPASGRDSAERLGAAKKMLRGTDRSTTAEQALQAALAAHPVEAQAAINTAIDGATLAPVLAAVKAHIVANPFAAIDAHPLVKAARDHFVAHLPAVMVAKDELRQAREDARVTAEINRSKNSAALKQALTSDFASLYLEEVTRLIQKEDGMRQAMGEHIPALLNSKVSGANIALALANAKPEDLMDAFTDPRVKKLSMTPGVFPPTYPLIALQTAINEHIADGDVALNEAVEKDEAVIRARNELETISVQEVGTRIAAFNNDPDVQQAWAQVTYGAHVREVQEKCHQQLTTRPKSITFENGVVTFTPVDQSGQSQSPITLSAEDARDEVNKVLQGYTRYFEEVERAYNERLSDADKTLEATKNSEFGEGAIERVSEAMGSLKALEMLDPAVKANIEQAEAFLSELRRGESPLERLFNAVEVDKAKKEVEAAKKEVTTREKALVTFKKNTPARLRQLGRAGVVGAPANAAILAELIVSQEIIDKKEMPGGGTPIQRARAQDYINLINAEIAELAAPNAADIQAAKTRIFSEKPNVRDARMEGLRAVLPENNSLLRTVLNKGTVDANRALEILRLIAEGKSENGNTTYKGYDKAGALQLLTDIDERPGVRQAINEALDDEPGSLSNKEWQKVIQDDAEVKKGEEGIQVAQDNVSTKQAAALKITEQVKTKMALDDPKTSKLIKSSEAIRQVPEKAKESGEDLTLKHKTLEQQKQTYAAKAADAFHAVTSSVSRSMGF